MKKKTLLCNKRERKHDMNESRDHLSWTLKVSYQAFFPYFWWRITKRSVIIFTFRYFPRSYLSLFAPSELLHTYRDSIKWWDIIFENEHKEKLYEKGKKNYVDRKSEMKSSTHAHVQRSSSFETSRPAHICNVCTSRERESEVKNKNAINIFFSLRVWVFVSLVQRSE